MSKLIDVFISVGSNIDPEKNIIKALDNLRKYVNVIAISTFYQTKAIDRPTQADFVNGVFHIQTDIHPRRLKFDVLRKIEFDLGRIRSDDKYTDRTIDLDIAIYGDMVINEPDLVIPDKDIRKRPFIAVPLLELSPSLKLPDTGEMLSSLDFVRVDLDIKPVNELVKILREAV